MLTGAGSGCGGTYREGRRRFMDAVRSRAAHARRHGRGSHQLLLSVNSASSVHRWC